MRIQNNIAAYNSYRQYSISSSKRAKSTEKASGGSRINRSADDAAGLSISEKMRAQIRGLNRASTNVQDGVSLLDVADSALQKCHDIVGRMREIAVQSTSDTNSNILDREALDMEYQQLKDELDEIANNTTFNGIKLLDGSIAKLSLVGITYDVNGLHDYNGQTSASTVVNGINVNSTSAASFPTKPAVAVTMPPVTGATASGTVSSNGESLATVLALGDDPAHAALQGRTNAGLTAIEADGDLAVSTNSYTGLVTNDDGSSNLTVSNNSGFVYNNGDNTTISNNDHTGQVRIDSNADATATIGNNTGGEIQVGTIDSLTITNNSNFTGNRSSSYDYTYYYTYTHTDGTTSRIPSSGSYASQDDRVNTALRPQADAGGFSDGISGVLQPDGVTYIDKYSTSGTYNGKPVNAVTYYYTLQNKSEYSEPKTASSAYNYAYNTFWDEYQQGQIRSDALSNTVISNGGYLDLTNTSAGSLSTITNNSGTIYTANQTSDVTTNSGGLYLSGKAANVAKNQGTIVADSNVGTLNVTENTQMGYSYSNTYSIGSDGQYTTTTLYNVGITSSADKTNIGTNSGSAVITRGELTVTKNSGYMDIKNGVAVKNIGENTGTVILQSGADVTDWMAAGINNSGTIELRGATTPNPMEVASSINPAVIKVTGGASVSIDNNTGPIEISGGRIGGAASSVTIENNSGTIRNGGTLTLDGTNTGVINNYGIVQGDALDTSTTIRHFATNIDTSGVTFPAGLDLSTLDIDALNTALQEHECTIKFEANGQTFTLAAKWTLKNVDTDGLSCSCDSAVDICDADSPVTLDAFELVFDLKDATLVSKEGLVPANFDGGNVVFSESADMLAGTFLYELGSTVSISGESGKVGTKLTFHADLEATYTAAYEENTGLIIQSGANQGDITPIYIEKISTDGLGDGGCLGCNCGSLSSTNVLTHESSQKAIELCSTATDKISQNRANIGAMHNRLEYKIMNLDLSSENLASTESRIRDVDMAKEMTSLLAQNVISQGSTKMLSVANNFSQAVLQMLQNV